MHPLHEQYQIKLEKLPKSHIPAPLIMPKTNPGSISDRKLGMTQEILPPFPDILP